MAVLKVDMADSRRVEALFVAAVMAGLEAFETACREGRQPPPFVYRITGSDTAPNLIWGTLQDAGLGLLIDPQLLFELNHFYSERDGIGVKITRYMKSIETHVLPVLDGDPACFYVERAGSGNRFPDRRFFAPIPLSARLRTARAHGANSRIFGA